MLIHAARTSNALDEFSTESLLHVYAEGPVRLRKAVSDLNEEELTVFPFKDKWSIKEIAFHLLDSELIGSIRFRQTITQSDTTFPFYNQEIWTKELEYQQRDIYELQQALEMFRLLRLNNTRLLQSAKEFQWKLKGFHPEKGELSLRQLLEIYADHSERHIDQILAKRRLFGKPLDLPVILHRRLY
jgi:hypothetical protein